MVNKVPPILCPLFHILSNLVERGRSGKRFSLGCFERDLTLVGRGSSNRGDRCEYGQERSLHCRVGSGGVSYDLDSVGISGGT